MTGVSFAFTPLIVTPAQAGVQSGCPVLVATRQYAAPIHNDGQRIWTPAYAGVTAGFAGVTAWRAAKAAWFNGVPS